MQRGFIVSLAWLSFVVIGCAGPRANIVYSFQELDCSSCLSAVAQELGARPGVDAAKMDKNAVEVRVTYDTTAVSPDGLDQVVEAKGFPWSHESGAGSWAPEILFPASMDVKTISHDGEAVDLAAHLAPGKVTVIDFYAPWCGPCRVVTHELKEVMSKRSDVALRKVNIVDWDRPVVAQHLQGVVNIPYVLVFGKDGQRVAAITGLKKEALREAILKAGGPAPSLASEPTNPEPTNPQSGP
jgi:thiol-disulfide isomerase/thioredoxin